MDITLLRTVAFALIAAAVLAMPAEAQVYRCADNRFQATPCHTDDQPEQLAQISVVQTRPSRVETFRSSRRADRHRGGGASAAHCRRLLAQRESVQARLRRGYSAEQGVVLRRQSTALYDQMQAECRQLPQRDWR